MSENSNARISGVQYSDGYCTQKISVQKNMDFGYPVFGLPLYLDFEFCSQKVFLPKGSAWLKSKWKGEQAVLEEFPDATIIRSVDVYGRGDHFLEYVCFEHRYLWF